MKTIYFKIGYENVQITDNVACIGYFDGVHRGHQALIKATVKEAQNRNLKSMVISFDPSPKSVVKNEKQEKIMLMSEKKKVLESLGVDYFLVIHFDNKLMSLDPVEFIDQVLINNKVNKVFVGNDFRFGYKGEGDADYLKKYLETDTVSDIRDQNGLLSSTRIKKEIKDGQVDAANEILGRSYQLNGYVMHGKKRGRLIGFPTLNIKVSEEKVLPASGVYACFTEISDKIYHSTVNIGNNPTFKDIKDIKIESYVHDFNETVYGLEVNVYFIKKLRDEINFDSINDLIEQMKKDVILSEKILGSVTNEIRPAR